MRTRVRFAQHSGRRRVPEKAPTAQMYTSQVNIINIFRVLPALLHWGCKVKGFRFTSALKEQVSPFTLC